MKMFRKAIDIDQNYALAYTGLCWGYQHRFQITRNKKDFDRVIKNAETTYKIDPNLAESNAMIAWIYYTRGEYEKSYQCYKKTLGMNPNYAPTNHITALFFRGLGLLHQAIKYSSRSIELDPLYVASHSLGARLLIYNGEHDKAVTQIEKSFEIEPDNFWSLLDYSLLFIMKKKYDKAEEFLSKAEKINPKYSSVRFYKSLLFASKGEKDKALSLRKNAAIYSLLGMKDEAIKDIAEETQKDYEHFQYTYLPLMNNHFYDNLRDDPRFQKILKAQKKRYEDRLKKFGDL
jgi:tetratricopeptide (TPR) repeat protein